MIELTGLRKVRERIKELEDNADSYDKFGFGRDARMLKSVETQFQSDLRAIVAELISLKERINADYEKQPFSYKYKTLIMVDSLISAIDSALVEEK